MDPRFRAALTAGLLLTAPLSDTQEPKARITEVTGPVQLAAQPDLLPGEVEAFPRVLPGQAVTGAVAAKINAALARANARVKAAAIDCRASSREAQGKADPAAWQRGVEVTMRGPRFLAFLATDSYYCGGAYPNDGLTMPLVYDLAMGSPVNWLKLLPAGVKGVPSNGADGTNTADVTWPALTRMGKAQADTDCKDAYDDSVKFALNLDARSGSVVAMPTSFPHVIQACADNIELDTATLQKVHAASQLTDALQIAKSLQTSANK